MMPRFSVIDEVKRAEDDALQYRSQQQFATEAEYDTHIPLPIARRSKQPACDLLRAMPVGASKFFVIGQDQAASYCKSAGKEGRKYARRGVTENGVHGVRIWRTA